MAGNRKNVKILLIGDANVGKTSIMTRYTDSVFCNVYICTIGIDFKVRDLEKNGRIVRLQLWDTAGHEQFHTVTPAYYRGASGVLLVYDISCRKSFANVTKWIHSIDERCSENIVKFLIGNKCDLHECYRMVTPYEGEGLAKEWGFKFMEVSAKNGCNIESCFNQMTDNILEKDMAILSPALSNGLKSETISLHPERPERTKKKQKNWKKIDNQPHKSRLEKIHECC